MFFKDRKSFLVRLVLTLILLAGALGATATNSVLASTIMVTTTGDSGAGSLRQAIANATSGDTIAFDPSLAGQTITLVSNLTINKSLTIDGSGLSPQVTISGGNVAHLVISPYSSIVTISDLTISNGRATSGGAIQSLGNLTLVNSTLKNNVATSSGGAILASGPLTVVNTTVYQNQAGSGGALMVNGVSDITIVNSTITQNQASSRGGAFFMNGGSSIDIFNSTIAANTAANKGGEYFINGGVTVGLYNTVFVCTLTDSSKCYYKSGTVAIDNHNSVLGIGTLADYGLDGLSDHGGPTQTMALFAGSTLVDTGDDAICAGSQVNNQDQRGVTRPQGTHCDIGAYEYDGGLAQTITSITTMPNPTQVGYAVTAAVSVISEAGTPTGTVEVSVAGNVVCTLTLVEGTGTCNIVFNTVGSIPVTATYSGDNHYLASSGVALQEVLANYSTPTFTPTSSPTVTPASMFVQVVQPNGGDVLNVGSTYPITWNSTPDIDKVSIGYKSCESCLDWIATNIPNDGYYDWNVFVGNTVNTQFKIYIIGYDTGVGSTTDVSDNSFTVLQLTDTPTPFYTPTFIPTDISTPTPYYTPTVIPTDISTSTPYYTPTFIPTITSTPVIGCNSIRDTIQATLNPIKLSTTTMYLDIPNANPYPVTIGNVYVAWNYDKGHVGSNTSLHLLSAKLNSTVFWTGDVYAPSYTIPLSAPVVIPANATSRLTFTFNQTYNRSSGEEILIAFSTPGCEAYLVHVIK